MRCALVAVICLAASQAMAQESPCGPTGKVEARIAKEYGESIVGAGVTAGGVLFTTMNPDTGTWSILMRRKDGQTCVLMGGTGYAIQEPTIPGVKS